MALIKNCFSLKTVLLSVSKQSIISSERYIARWVSPTLRELKRRRDRLNVASTVPRPEPKRSAFLEWNHDAELSAVGPRIGEPDLKVAVLRTALTHPSYKHVAQTEEDNSELVRAGEQFMTTCLARLLAERLPALPETSRKTLVQHLMRASCLAGLARQFGVVDIILSAEYPPSEEALSGSAKAVLGAVLECCGEDRAGRLLQELLLPALTARDILELTQSSRALEELTSALGYGPERRLCASSAPGTVLAAYRVALYAPQPQRTMLGIGWGEDVDTATEVAARDALARLHRTATSMPSIN